jgi:hypothetical protein
MLRKPLLYLAYGLFCGGAVQIQIAQAGDDIWDLMNPAWWADRFDDDDDDWDYWRYGRPYHGGPYGWGYPPYPAYPFPPQQPVKKKPPAPLPVPE